MRELRDVHKLYEVILDFFHPLVGGFSKYFECYNFNRLIFYTDWHFNSYWINTTDAQCRYSFKEATNASSLNKLNQNRTENLFSSHSHSCGGDRGKGRGCWLLVECIIINGRSTKSTLVSPSWNENEFTRYPSPSHLDLNNKIK